MSAPWEAPNGAMLMFSDPEIRQLLYCCAEELRARTHGKPPGPAPWLRNLVRRLELEVAASSTRQASERDESCSEHDEVWIGSLHTAQMLGWDIRKVQRRAADFGGQKVGARWVFRESAVREYLEGLTG